MKILTLAAAKGGVGKSTLAAALSTAAALTWANARIGLLDQDPQGSLTHWWNARPRPQPLLLNAAGGALLNAAGGALLYDPDLLFDEHLDLLVIDSPPSFSAIREQAIAVADLVLVPTGPGALDMAAVASTADMAEQAGVPFRFVLNRGLFRSRLAGQAVTALRERGGLLPPVHQRVAIAAAMVDGRTALETEPAGAAARELWPSGRPYGRC